MVYFIENKSRIKRRKSTDMFWALQPRGGEKVNGKLYFVSAARDGTAVDLQNEGLKDFSLTLIGVPWEIPLAHVGLKSIMRVRRKNVPLKKFKNVHCPGI
jgi:hypothetical protein